MVKPFTCAFISLCTLQVLKEYPFLPLSHPNLDASVAPTLSPWHPAVLINYFLNNYVNEQVCE